MDEIQKPAVPRYRWPWFVLGGVVLGAVLAVLWMSAEVQRVRQQRQPNPWGMEPSSNK